MDDPRLPPADGEFDAGTPAPEAELLDAEGAEADAEEAELAGDEADHREDDGDPADVPEQADGAVRRRRPAAATPAPVDIESRERAARAEGELAALRRQSSAPPQPSAADLAAQARQEQEYLATLTLDQRTDYMVNKALRTMEGRVQAQSFQLQDQIDRNSFASMTRESALAKRLAPEVERRLGEMRAQGFNITREALLDKVIGEQVRAGTLDMKATKDTAARNRARHESNGRAPASMRRPQGPKPGSPEAQKAARDKRLSTYQL